MTVASRLAIVASLFFGAVCIRAVVQKPDPTREDQSLRRPFSEFPIDVFGAGWIGRDEPLPDRVIRIARVSEHLFRHYEYERFSVIFYAGLVTGDSVEGGVHHPELCFTRQGQRIVERAVIPLPASGLEPTPLVNEFRWTAGGAGQSYSLSTFYYEGRFHPDPKLLRKRLSVSDISSYTGIILAGDYVGTPAETRAVYTDMLSRALPILVEFLPK